MILRQFNEEGIAAVLAFLTDLRGRPETSVPLNLLESAQLTEVVSPEVEMEQRDFSTRADAAWYLSEKLVPFLESKLLENRGMWTWLSLHYFDAVCPARGGVRRARSTEFYVYDPKHVRRAYYHLLYIPWRIVRLAPDHCRLFLSGPVHQQSEVTREVMKRLYLLRIPSIFEVLDRLYWDEIEGRPRKGIVSKDRVTPGDLRNRFPIRIRQLEKTYDLVSLNARQLIDLLGDEFKRHKRGAVPA
jgi:hypothetical protein